MPEQIDDTSNGYHRFDNSNNNQSDEEENNTITSNKSENINTTKMQFLTPEPKYSEISTIRKLSFVSLIVITQLLTQSFLSQSIVPYHYIARTFNIENNPGEVSWMSAAFSLTVGTFILISGRFGDLLGYKKVYIFSYINAFVWCLLCGISSYSGSIEFFDVCRGMQGLSLALATPNSLALIGHYFPDGKEKIFSFALFGAVAPGGFYIGALWDSVFALRSTWQWMFYISAIVSLIIALLGYLIIPKNIGTYYPTKKIEMFDPIGSILGVSGLILINFAFNQGPVVGWEKPYVYILLIIGILLMCLFAYSQTKVKYPLIPKLNTNIIFTLLSIAAGWSSFGIWLFYLLRFSLDILKQSPIVVAIQFTPTMLSGLVASFATGIFINIVPTSLIILVAMLAFFVGNTLNAFKPVSQVYWIQRFISCIVMPFAMDTSFPAGTILLSRSLPRESQGVAGSLIATVVNYAIAIGLGIAGTVEYYTTKHGATELQGIRNAMYTGMGLAGFAIIVATIFNIFVFINWKIERQENKNDNIGNIQVKDEVDVVNEIEDV
ncbi:hypothetical protein C6P42_001482 [Pichia californica]|nr:hypothetical protein C6P42_001482 [[Candida] californica]